MSIKETVLRPLARNLRCGLRISLFRPFDTNDLQADIYQVVLLSLVGFSLTALFEFINVAPQRVFDRWGIVSQLASYAIFLLTLVLVTRIQRQVEKFVVLAVALLATDPVGGVLVQGYRLLVVHTSLGRIPWSMWTLYGLLLMWIPVVMYRVQRRIFAGSRWRSAAGSAVYFLGSIGLLIWLPHTKLWYTAYRAESPQQRVDVEKTYYAQPALLQSELSRLKPSRSGVHNIYFVGVAGWAEQNVFMDEISSVRRLFRQRFDTAGHSVVLINNPTTVRSVPLADASNLQQVLDRVGKMMNPKRDMLFLYITSHGSENQTIAFHYWPLSLDNLTAEHLRTIIANAHIGWRTVVLSSCYSGGFVDALKSPRALIITAAAADRTSFGCSSTNTWTYFGNAYFHRSLAHTTDFIKAFREARGIIARRESRHKFTPSRPQIWVGGKMEKFLPQVESQLAMLDRNNRRRAAGSPDEQHPAVHLSSR